MFINNSQAVDNRKTMNKYQTSLERGDIMLITAT